MRFSTLLAFSTVAVLVPGSLGGILTYGICQTGEWLQRNSASHYLTMVSLDSKGVMLSL